MWENILEPWPWYVSGPLIGLTVPMLFWILGKPFGLSSNFRHLCAIGGSRFDIPFLKYDWKVESWNLVLFGGLAVGAALAAWGFSDPHPDLIPEKYHSLSGVFIQLAGGFLIGFGTRYAGGCTSGHAITGLSTLQWPSLLATCGFFAGGLFVTHIVRKFLEF